MADAETRSPCTHSVPMELSASTYSQSTGIVAGPDGATVASGWAGNGHGKNNPTEQATRCVGPLPQGLYVVGEWTEHPRLGRMVAPLTMIEGDAFGRSEFWIHGPSTKAERYGQESLGCIVIPYAGRLRVKDLLPGGTYLQVTA